LTTRACCPNPGAEATYPVTFYLPNPSQIAENVMQLSQTVQGGDPGSGVRVVLTDFVSDLPPIHGLALDGRGLPRGED
jgi:hypothetical protein